MTRAPVDDRVVLGKPIHIETWRPLHNTDRRLRHFRTTCGTMDLHLKGSIIAYHTSDPLYRGEANRMKASAAPFGLALHIEELAPSSWLEVVRSKVQFLIRAREQLRGPLLYVDVDAIFHADPWLSLGHMEADVAFALLMDNKARSGTIYLADTQGAANFLADWQQRLRMAPEAWDQHPLTDIAHEAADGKNNAYRWQNLPPGLCYIFDRAEETAGPNVTPVIEHLQASREIRNPSGGLWRSRRRRVRELDELFGTGPQPTDADG